MKSLFIVLFALLALSTSTVKAQECATCELVVQFIEQWVESNATDAEILQYLDTICSLFPGYQSTCDSIAEQGLAQIIAWINQNETPTQICTQLGQCTSSKTSTANKFNVPSLTRLQKFMTGLPKITKPVAPQGVECGGCEEVITVIEQWLENTDDQSTVITAIEVVCTYMPGWETTCDAMVAAGVPAVVNWIATYQNSTVVCDELGMCQAEVVHVADDCGECQQIVATIENYVTSNQSEQTVEEYMETVCKLIPQWTSICGSGISGELPEIMDMIAAEENPLAICTSVGYCVAPKGFKFN